MDKVEKFNPYHGKDGRFTGPGGATSFTIATRDQGKQHLADKAKAKEALRTAADQKSKPKEPEKPKPTGPSIAGVERGEPMTFEEADSGKTNPKFFLGSEYQRNCQTCVVANEMRRRGYDIEAGPRSGKYADELAHKTNKAWIDPKTGDHPDYIEEKEFGARLMWGEKAPTATSTIKFMEDTIKPGERYTIQGVWGGRGMTGHIVSVERDADGSLRMYDPQTNQIYRGTGKGGEITNFIKDFKMTTTRGGAKFNIAPRLLRVDNMEPNVELLNNIMRPAK